MPNTQNGAQSAPLNYLSGLVRVWKAEFSERSFRFKLLLIPGLFVIYAAVTQRLCNYVQMRKGIQLDDTILHYLPVADFSVFIFLLLYSSMILAFAAHLHQPKLIIRFLEMQALVGVTRQIFILLVALEPPHGIVMLKDVFLENTFYPHSVPMTKDLFFSGHVATIWLYCLCVQGRNLKIWLGIATILMGLMLLSMRVHYSYDVYGAIVITTIIYTVHAAFSTRNKVGYPQVSTVAEKSLEATAGRRTK